MTAEPILGLGRLHHIPTEAGRYRLLDAAMAAGFTTFDMAPSYGEGLVEATVGRFLRSKAERPRIFSKFGIPFAPVGELPAPLFFFLRGLRKLTRAPIGANYAARHFSEQSLRASVAASLRRLRVQYIDCLFIHEPLSKPTSSCLAETIAGLERLKEEGLIRGYGLTVGVHHVDELLATGGGFSPLVKFMVPATKGFEVLLHGRHVPNEICVYDLVTHLKACRGITPTPADVASYCRAALPTVAPIVASRHVDRIAAYGYAFAIARP